MLRWNFGNWHGILLLSLTVHAFFVSFFKISYSALFDVGIQGRKMTHCFQVTIFKGIFPDLCTVRRCVVSVCTSLSSFLGCCWITQVRHTAHSRIVLDDSQSRVFLCRHMSGNGYSFLLRRFRTAARGTRKTELKQRHTVISIEQLK